MELRLGIIERRLESHSNMERLQKEQGRVLEILLRQMGRVPQEHSTSRSRGTNFHRRAEYHACNQEGMCSLPEAERENTHLRPWSYNGQHSEEHWQESQPPRSVERDQKFDLPSMAKHEREIPEVKEDNPTKEPREVFETDN